MAAAWPGVVQYLLDTLPTLTGWEQAQVFDGPPNTGDDPPDYCTVGFVQDDSAGSFTQTQNEDGWHVNEDGNVRCDLTSQTGDSTLDGPRSRVFAMFDALDDHLRKDQTLGGRLSANATVVLASDGIQAVSNERGVAISIACTLAYYTETFTP